MLRYLAALMLTMTFAAEALAQQWAVDMFDSTSHDFGVVARGAKVEHVFTIENKYLEDAHIASIRSSCTCTSTTSSPKTMLKTWEKFQIKASVDTRGFLGRKDATITVVFDKPFPAEVQLHTQCYIRRDVVVQPGAILFGSVGQGSEATKKAKVSYAGRNDWAVEKVECQNPNVEAEIVELIRRVGSVDYELRVKLKEDAPVGYIHDQLMLVTNDPGVRSSHIPVPIEASVVRPVEISPTLLSLGIVDSGQTARGRLIVKSKRPFRVKGATSEDARFTCTLPDPERLTTVHLLPVNFSGNATPGKISTKIKIETDVPGCEVMESPVEIWIKEPQRASEPTEF